MLARAVAVLEDRDAVPRRRAGPEVDAEATQTQQTAGRQPASRSGRAAWPRAPLMRTTLYAADAEGEQLAPRTATRREGA